MYIVSMYSVKPFDPNSTSKPNFFKNPNNFMADEIVAIVRNLRDKDLKRANVILDITNKSVIKCRDYQIDNKVVNSATIDYKTLFDYFYKLYSRQIDAALGIDNTIKESPTQE